MRIMEDLGKDPCREEKEEVEHGEVFDLLFCICISHSYFVFCICISYSYFVFYILYLIHLTSEKRCRRLQQCAITGDLLPDI